MRFSSAFFLLILIIFSIGCDTKYKYIELKMPKKNPTSYEFDASIEQIQDAIRQNFFHIPGKYLGFASDTNLVWGEDILAKPENVNDAFIYLHFGDSSRVYHRIDEDHKMIPYWYSIHIHITSIGERKTKVEVRAINPTIGIGIRFPMNVLPREPGAAIEKDVPTSTIEEYEILLEIGDALGVKNKMDPIVLPEPAPHLK